MRADRRGWLFVMGLAVVVATAACGGGGSGTGGGTGGGGATETFVARGEPIDSPTSNVSPVAGTSGTSGSLGAGAVTSAPAGGTDPKPSFRHGIPQVTATPTRAPAGTRVDLEGYGFVGPPWQEAGGSLWLVDQNPAGECVALAELDHDVSVTADGHLTGGFTVPATAECRYSTAPNGINPASLTLDLAYQCIDDCRIGTFAVVPEGESMEEPTGTRCDPNLTVTFGVQDFASDIYADGLSCDDAESFIRDHTEPLGPQDGLAHLDADGFSCDRTGESHVFWPRANYKCTRGAQVIHFVRS